MTYTVRTCGPHRGPRQALRRDRGAERAGPRRRAGHRARPARPQRRRQDDRRAHPHHAARPHRGPRVRRRPRRRARARAVARADLARRPAGVARRAPDRAREPDAARAPAEALQGRRGRAHRRSCSSASGSRTRPTARSAPTPAACAAGSTSRPAWSCTARSSSSTSRPPGSIRPAAPRCGARSRAWSPTAPRSLLTTQYLEEADRLADEIVVLRDGRTVAAARRRELKARVGDRRVHVSLPRRRRLPGAARLFERLEPELDVRARRLTVPAPDGPRDLRAALDALEHAGVDGRGGLAEPADARRRVLRARRRARQRDRGDSAAAMPR